MLDVKQTLKDAEERMESAILYVWIPTDRKCH